MGKQKDPRVFAKDLKGVSLYAEKIPILSYDKGPFTVCYLTLLFRTFLHLFSGTW